MTKLHNPDFNLLAVEFFFVPLNWHRDNCLHTFRWAKIFSMSTVWQVLFSLVLMFPRLRIEASPLSKVLDKQFLSEEPGNSISTFMY